MSITSLILTFPLWISSFFVTESPNPSIVWSEWNKYNDCPGLEYRTSCIGESFEGSKFHKLQVEIINSYNSPVSAEIMVVDDFEMNVSEIQKIKLIPGFNKKLQFNLVKLPCMGSYDFKIFAKLH
ncbi:MAG: hypothetical protein M3512_06845 [Bacteroidota bacterium]|nr:hypothetical protein [Bacteroidota bacterium]